MTLSLSEAIDQVNSIFATYDSASTSATAGVVGDDWKAGKVYEAWVLAWLLEQMATVEGFEVVLVGGTKVCLKSSAGPINEKYPHFRLTRPGDLPYDVWTDVEFSTLSYTLSGSAGSPKSAHRHELDVVMVVGDITGYPGPTDVVLGIECKNTGFQKSMARAALGVRRELSFLAKDKPTVFTSWPQAVVPADPASVLLVCSTDPTVANYNAAGDTFGVAFLHLPMP